ncbi:hypothetical protein CGRA01v4_01380 [Colletotrichum graminicola]|nr:hypothetical protein CGRA01v4_01380 [Colletotrichum graminicola]
MLSPMRSNQCFPGNKVCLSSFTN